jgi:LacI family transcriptional regulator
MRSQIARPTLVDVARRAGVSVSTASNALTGGRPVSGDADRRVRRAAEELAYEPDRAARSLVSRRSDTIGIVVPDLTNPFFAELGRQVQRRLAERGYAALIGDTDNGPDRQEHHLAAFESRRVDGLIVVPAVSDDDGRLRHVARRTPTVLLDRIVGGWPGSSVSVRQAAGIEAIVDHLLALGHRQFAFVAGSLSASTGRDRFAAFTRLLDHRGVPPPVVVEAEFTLESGREAVRGLLDRAGDRVTAVCAADDLLAFAVLEGARLVGIRIPDDMSLTGFDDIPYASFVHPSLTTVRQPTAAMSERAVELLLRHLSGDARPEAIVLEPELVVRDSTRPPRTVAPATPDLK